MIMDQITFNTPQNLIQSPGDLTPGNSVLFLFSPRKIVDHYKRPLQYNFNEQMTYSVIDNIVRTPSHVSGVGKVISSTPGIQSSVIPVAHGGIDVRTSKYSDYWMFVLIIDDNTVRNILMSNKLVTRTIMIGICSDEPISQFGMNSATPEQFINPNCQLVVTRQLRMTKYATANANGYGNRLTTNCDNNVVQFDDDIWNNGKVAGGESFFTLHPNQVQSVATSDGMYSSSIVRHDNSINVLRNATIQAELESPKKHIATILTGLETGVCNLEFGNNIGNFSEHISPLDDPSGVYVDAVQQAFNELGSVSASVGDDITQNFVNVPISIGRIMMQYKPKVFPIITPQSTQADIIPQNVTSRNTIFSSLVSAVLPTYLNAVGISSVTFMYNSPTDSFNVMDIESSINVSQDVLRHKWEAFAYLIKNELFPVLFENAGPFDLQVHCVVNGTVDVILNFLDFQPLPVGVIYQENAVLGGIVSPLVGTVEHLRNNAVQLNNLVMNVSTAFDNKIC